MENNKNLWNKTADELTVGDVVKINLAVPAIMVGAAVAIGAGITVFEKAANKIQKIKNNRTNLTIVE